MLVKGTPREAYHLPAVNVDLFARVLKTLTCIDWAVAHPQSVLAFAFCNSSLQGATVRTPEAATPEPETSGRSPPATPKRPRLPHMRV